MTSDPFERWKELKQEMDEVIRKPEPEPTDWLDELEAERLEGEVWKLSRKGQGQ